MKLNLRNQIILANTLVVILLSVVIVWALLNIVSLGQASDAILRENYRSISAASDMQEVLDEQVLVITTDGAITGSSALGDAGHADSVLMLDAEFLRYLSRAEDNITLPGEENLVRDLSVLYHRFRASVRNMSTETGRVLPDREDEGFSDLLRQALQIRDTLEELLDLNEERMYEASNQAAQISYGAIVSTLVVTGVIVLIVLILSFYLSSKIVSPIYRLAEASRSLSRGDYNVKVRVSRSDELGTLSDEFNEMARKLGHFHDMNIEQLVREKSKADAILSSIEDGLVVFDDQLKVISINPAAQRIFKIDALNAMGSTCESVFSDSILCPIIRDCLESLSMPDLPEEQRYISLASDADSVKQFQYSLSFIRTHKQTVSGVILMLRDITRLKELDAMKSEFVMAASHELKTPLTSLGMSTDLLMEKLQDRLDPVTRDLLDTTREEIAHMKSLTEDLLELSRLESGRITLDMEEINIADLHRFVEQAFSSQFLSRQIRFDWKIENDLHGLHGDANKITWVLSNLISNALRYVPAGGFINISTVRVGYNIHFSVADNGPGIPAPYQSRIFRKFSQVDGLKSGGSGLGLAICREIIRAHGGTIWVESKEGEGSIFTFTIPASSRPRVG